MPYFYEHALGPIIEKPAVVVNTGGGPWEYFDSPFVRRWWFESDLLRPLRMAAPRDRIAPAALAQARGDK